MVVKYVGFEVIVKGHKILRGKKFKDYNIVKVKVQGL